MNRSILLLLLLLPLTMVGQDPPHTSIFGTYGAIQNPTARFGQDRMAFVGFGYLPFENRIIHNNWEEGRPERLIHVNLMFLSFLNVSAHLVQPLNQEVQWGIGDRSIKVRLKLLKEGKYHPQIALGLHDIISTNTYNGAFYLVANKSFPLPAKLKADVHGGYGYDLQQSNALVGFLWQENPAQNNSRLTGIFGGVELQYHNQSLLVEYDTEKWNAGYSVLLSNQWVNRYLPSLRVRVGVYSLGFERFTGQIGIFYRFGDRFFSHLERH